MFKRLYLVAALATANVLSVAAQSTASLPNAPVSVDWEAVQSLPVGTQVYVKANGVHLRCDLAHVDAQSFTCDRGVVFKRSDIESIKQPRRLISTLTGAGIGAAAGIALAEATYKPSIGYNRAGAAVGGGVSFGAIGALVGYFTDFTRSTIYRIR